MLIYFLNYAYIKLISEYKDSFGKYYPVFPKNSKNLDVKFDSFWLKFKGENCNKKSYFFFSFFDIETLNLKVRSITETVLENQKKKLN